MKRWVLAGLVVLVLGWLVVGPAWDRWTRPAEIELAVYRFCDRKASDYGPDVNAQAYGIAYCWHQAGLDPNRLRLVAERVAVRP